MRRRPGRSLEHVVPADPASRRGEAGATRADRADGAARPWSPSSTRSRSARRCANAIEFGVYDNIVLGAGLACLARGVAQRARPPRLDRDGHRGARLGDRRHRLDVHRRRPATTRRSRRSPTSASSPSTPPPTSRSCCCCARACRPAHEPLARRRDQRARRRRGRDGDHLPGDPRHARRLARAAVTTNIAYPLPT